MTLPVETEAELQARIESRIRAALPLLPAQIQLEKHLHLRLGHHAIVIDGHPSEKEATRGRYDVLVRAEGKPLLIAELKAPDVAIESDDVAQALSYARLHDPPVPLVLVTNGTTTTLRRTYDGSELQRDDVAAERLSAVLSAAAAVAAAASEDAVRTLLGASRTTWAQMLSSWSQQAIDAATGALRDLRQPIARGFTFPREAAKQAAARVLGGARVVVIDGPPLSGVTHVLVQVATHPDVAPCLFIDGKETADVLQHFANRLSRELSFGVSKDDVRGWLNTAGSLMGVTLVIDGLPRDDFDELMELATAGALRLVLGLDAETYRRNSIVPGRNEQSQLGRVASAIDLEPLSEDEFYAALNVVDEACAARFFNGAQHAPQLRWPRTLRVIAASLPTSEPGPKDPDGRAARLMIPPIPGPMILDSCSQAFASEPSLKFDLRALAKAYLLDVEQNVDDPERLSATWGRPSVDAGLLERELGEARVRRLHTNGFLSWVDTKDLGPRVLVRVEELLAHHVADEWAAQLGKLTENSAIVAQIDRYLHLSDAIPGGEVALAAALMRAVQRSKALLGIAIPMLVDRKPTTSRLKEGARIEVLLKDARIRLRFGEGMDEEVVGDLQPWLVLSHLSSLPMAVDGYEKTANLSIFSTLGVWPHLLYRPPVTELARVPGFHIHEITGIGSVPCLSTGIVEPLLQAMLDHAHSYPDEIVELAQIAMEQKEAHLAWRVLTVALAAQNSTDPAVERASTQVATVLREWWGKALDAAVHKD
jgi:hypothetical protein